jgi:4-amino-4-deoxy-L-arabinose transferase-like glycosyltransferase
MSSTTSDRTGPPPEPGYRGRSVGAVENRPAAVRVALAVLLAGTAVLYLWDLSASGYANEFYAAAVQAGTQSWKALLFGSLDPGNAITVDKPPASLWVMALSGRIFGFSSWSLLAPQAIEGVLSVGLTFAAVRRWSGPTAGLLAGAVLALTPVAALMFRFDNPDALLVLLMAAGAYCVVRATERASVRWLSLAGVAIGFAFLTKMLQGFLVLPAFAVVYLVAANTTLGRRIAHVLVAGLAVVVSAGWYVALVALWPAGSRPFIGGSTDNSLLELALGYNGLGRILGGQGNGGGGGGGGGNVGFGGSTGITRLFGDSMGTEISWLLPAALIGLVAGLWFTRHAPRTDRTRAALILWGGWLLVTGIVFSYMAGTIHPYYTVALAPAVGALVAIPARELWRGRDQFACRVVLSLMVAVTGIWDYILLARTSDWLPALRWIVLLVAAVAALLILLGGRLAGRFAVIVAGMALVGGLLGPSAYAVDTAAQPHNGSIPTSGPGTSGFGGGFGGPRGGGGGGMAGFGGGTTTGSALTTALRASTTRWAAATVGSQSAASLELSSGASVMAIGGFTGSDDSPTLPQFEAYVRAGEIHYFIAGGGMGGGPGGGGTASRITSWVESHYPATTIGGQTVYDLTK